jgi:hypothetical protein
MLFKLLIDSLFQLYITLIGFLAVNMELSSTTRQVPSLLSDYFVSFVNFWKFAGTLSGFIARVKPAPFSLLCASRGADFASTHFLACPVGRSS